ncbi:hypothetical protein CHARACLAT_022236 [Characodon lateralis]|uniref:Uncharacterized protein n=1 Tax=Characodon lateralis TaxID=208331 RepID=A0ABU7EWU8_9TELE|nr:hypothetical protein [Characodon lateralis]
MHHRNRSCLTFQWQKPSLGRRQQDGSFAETSPPPPLSFPVEIRESAYLEENRKREGQRTLCSKTSLSSMFYNSTDV